MTIKRYLLIILCSLVLLSCKSKTFVAQFDCSKEISQAKFALADINPNLPDNWEMYNYVVLEYKINTAQRFQVGFKTEDGYNELRVMCYVPNAWNKIAIPLKFYTQDPDAAYDLAATNNKPRYTGWINLGGKRGPLKGVDTISFRVRRAIGNVKIELRNVTLSVEDPGDEYMGEKPAFDKFGQSNLVDYPEKIKTLEQLQQAWKQEEDEIVGNNYNYSKFGGYMQKNVGGTGFFRVEKVDGKWWFVDPDGYLFLSVGVDCVNAWPAGSIRAYDKRPQMFEEIPSEDLMAKLNNKDGLSFGLWNIYRRYGDDCINKSVDMVIKRMDKWGLNTMANWSGEIVKNTNRKAFLHELYQMGFQASLMGLCDIYEKDFQENLDKAVKEQVTEFANNPWLIGYFLGNEPAWLNQEPRLCSLILDGPQRPIKDALKEFITKNGDTPENRTAFIQNTFKEYLKVSCGIIRKYDPKHLILGIRFGDPLTISEEILKMCNVFDVFSFNCYDLVPRNEMMDKVKDLIDIPMIIGEYHFGTVDRGYAQSLWQVESQSQRGVAYRYYTEHAYSHPSLIGTGYFQWADQDISGRFDGENYNCGLIDVTDRPYKEQVNAMMETAKVLYDIHCANAEPFNQMPVNCRGHEVIPFDLQ